jgi:hypothetical protein
MERGKWALWVFDEVTRAVAATMEIYLPYDFVREIMVRSPTFERSDFASWGDVTDSEARKLLDFEPDPDGIDVLRELTIKWPTASTRWSLTCVKA